MYGSDGQMIFRVSSGVIFRFMALKSNELIPRMTPCLKPEVLYIFQGPSLFGINSFDFWGCSDFFVSHNETVSFPRFI